MTTFFERDGERFRPTVFCRGPWNEQFQHGGPPSALLLHAMTRALADPGFVVARFTAEFVRPVPLAPLRIVVSAPSGGRSVRRVQAELTSDETVMQASALFIRRDPELAGVTQTREGHRDATWPDPDGFPSFEFPFFTTEEGYHRAIDLRVIDTPWGTTPVRCWARPSVGLVDGAAATPEEAVLVLADAESGMGPPVDPHEYTYLNPDLTVYFGRRPEGPWTGLAIRSRADGEGRGLSDSELRDTRGVFGRSAQSLQVARR